MEWTGTHARLLARAFEQVLGHPEAGAMAFTRCLAPEVVNHLGQDHSFAPQGWEPCRVTDDDDVASRSITADAAVERREAKGAATLLLVDTARAGAGMDGIYSASREVDEASLFDAALRMARSEVTRQLSSTDRQYAERAIRMARQVGNRHGVSPWAEFNFFVQVAEHEDHPGAHLHYLGLWPVREPEDSDATSDLEVSRKLVDRLLGVGAAGLTIPARIDSLQLIGLTAESRPDLERFLHDADALPLRLAMEKLTDRRHLWVGALGIESAQIQGIELSSWRLQNSKLAKWSGLVERDDDPVPSFILKPHAESSGEYSTLEVKWKPRPSSIAKGTVDYQVAVLTNNMEEELAVREVSHSARHEEKCRFNNDDFSYLDEDTLISAKVVVSVVGDDAIQRQESEEFQIRFGEPPDKTAGGAGKKVRAFSEGLIELDDRGSVSAIASSPAGFDFDEKRSAALLRTKGTKRLSLQVLCPPLIREVEKQWMGGDGAPGRWRVKARASGASEGDVEFIRFEVGEGTAWDRAKTESRRLARHLRKGSGVVGQVHDDQSRAFEQVRSYILAWAAALESGDPSLALCNTLEVQSLAGRTIGLIVLPMHPLRVAWHAAYDNLVLHAAFEQGRTANEVRTELQCLDGAMFPAFLPNPAGGSFVFADTLGFHAVGMVPDTDKEPKAAVAMLARALGQGESTDNAPTVGGQSANVVGDEIVKYLDCHHTTRLLHVHALRAGDGLTIARSFGRVHERLHGAEDEVEAGEEEAVTAPDGGFRGAPAFSLEMYPSPEQRGVVGRFIADARERRRSGAGVVSDYDRWMLESLSLPGGVNLPRLRWARKDRSDPETAAHVAVAFDTFESEVIIDEPRTVDGGPFWAFGLLSFYEREFTTKPTPLWRSTIPRAKDGEKHPSERGHTERLERVQRAVHGAVARHLGTGNGGLPVLRTAVSREKEDSLRDLHRLCDWVITLDRNAGVEYFDSPRDNQEIYDAYVIDCVPEREDLGCMQLITSTSNLDEVRTLLDCALDRMGLSRSRRNAEFLLAHLKSLSGRLAIRLTGNRPPMSELIALAVSHANCGKAPEAGPCWVSLERGFLVPVDDVRDLLPPLTDKGGGEKKDDSKEVRPDLIYVTTAPRKGLTFRFVEVKYRRDLRAARSPEILLQVQEQTTGLRKRWDDWYSHEVCSAFRAVRRAKLARVLRFYADKAQRHHLPAARHAEFAAELDRMIERGSDYVLNGDEAGDRGWVFCPEYAGREPLEISPRDWSTQVFLFGPGLLPDSNFSQETFTSTSSPPPPVPVAFRDDGPSGDVPDTDAEATESLATPETTDEGSSGEANNLPTIRLGTDAVTNTEVHWPLTIEGNPHLLIAGLPGMGKTTCLLNLCRQMIAANIRPIVFSYHQDIDERLERSVNPVRFIDFAGLGFNPLHVVDRDNRMAHLDVAGAVRDIFEAIYPDLGDIQASRIRKAIRDSFTEAGWGGAHAAGAEVQEPAFRRFVEILRADPKPNQSLRTLLERLDELDDYGFFQARESHGSLWEGAQLTVVRIHTTQNDNLQRAFAALVFYGLYKDMFRRGLQSRITHALIFDEAHRAAGLKLIPTMAKECRKYGISLVLASQEARDFNVSVFSAIANYLVLRLNEADAKSLMRNVSTSQQERALMDRIKQMDRFKALYFREGKHRPAHVDLSP